MHKEPTQLLNSTIRLRASINNDFSWYPENISNRVASEKNHATPTTTTTTTTTSSSSSSSSNSNNNNNNKNQKLPPFRPLLSLFPPLRWLRRWARYPWRSWNHPVMPNPSVQSSVAQPNDSGSWERPWWCPRCGPCPRRFEGSSGSRLFISRIWRWYIWVRLAK